MTRQPVGLQKNYDLVRFSLTLRRTRKRYSHKGMQFLAETAFAQTLLCPRGKVSIPGEMVSIKVEKKKHKARLVSLPLSSIH